VVEMMLVSATPVGQAGETKVQATKRVLILDTVTATGTPRSG